MTKGFFDFFLGKGEELCYNGSRDGGNSGPNREGEGSMRKVRCYECGKSYDFDVDDFCPKCGAFNQPGKSARIGTDGTVIRVDGINEKNHAGSFVHQELHAENRVRKAVGLSKGAKRAAQAAPRQAQARRGTASGWEAKKTASPMAIVKWVVLAVIAINVLSSFFGMLFW